MQTHREVDVRVARAMGWTDIREEGFSLQREWWGAYKGERRRIPNAATDLLEAMRVVDEMRARRWYGSHTDLTLNDGRPWYSWVFTDWESGGSITVSGLASTLPYAICLAALEALNYTR